jgi:protoporphyrinogen IX oxidase
MFDLLETLYPWTKALHVISVIAWMAGLFYLPRLFVYHVEKVAKGSDTDTMFQTMERRLFKAIMTPAMLSSWFFGTLLVLTPGIINWSEFWPWSKLVAVITLSTFHTWLNNRRIDFVNGTNTNSGRFYRLMNEVPTILLIIIVISVIVRPFQG